MTRNELRNRIVAFLGHRPTVDQDQTIDQLINFLARPDDQPVFIMNGYAGTGKTSLLGALNRALSSSSKKTILMAPTGRAAKVLSRSAKARTSTIHRQIYQLRIHANGGMSFALRSNTKKKVLFVIDEASMVSGAKSMLGSKSGSDGLLNDVFEYIFEQPGNQLLLIGDPAQLPPVGLSESLALKPSYLKDRFGCACGESWLRTVVRQEEESGILWNATALRNEIEEGQSTVNLMTSKYSDIHSVSGHDLEELIETLYQRHPDETLIVTPSNRRANLFNKQIRSRVMLFEDQVNSGDRMMIVKNNYFWLDNGARGDFLANGEQVEILRIANQEEVYGFHFADATIRLSDRDESPELEVKILLEVIDTPGPSLPQQQQNQLYESVRQSIEELPTATERTAAIRSDPYLNAIQLKHAYSVTCHKAQGGQWKHVIIDPGYLTSDSITIEWMRWLYTALTRATDEVYLLNFGPLIGDAPDH